MKIKKLILLIVTFFSLISCTRLEDISRQPPKAVHAVLDLNNWDFKTDGSVNLDGEWLFAWQQLMLADQINSLTDVQYVKVPDNWTDYIIEGIQITPEGFASYTLTVENLDTNQVYGIYIDGEGRAYSLWVDNQLLTQNGIVGKSHELMTAEKIPITAFFKPQADKVQFVMQISNFHHKKAGFRNSILLGLAEPINSLQLNNWYRDAFSVGILFILGLYHLIIFIFRSKNRAPLYFALICWLLAIRIGVTNENTLLINIPIISWILAFKIEYLTFFLLPLFFSMFMRSLYPEDIHKLFINSVIGLSVVFSLFSLFSDTMTASYLPTYYQLIIILEIVYYFYFMGHIIYKKREGSIYILLASIVLFTATIIEILYYQNILPYGPISTYGFIAYIFVQAMLLSSLFAKSFTKVETLSSELEETNMNLQLSEHKYRHIFEDSKDIIFISDKHGHIEDVNPASKDVLGYNKKELQNMNVLDVILKPEIRTLFKEAIMINGFVKNYNVELLRKDGKIINTLLTVSPHKNENGMDSELQGSIRDISATIEAEKERLRALKFEQISITDPLTKLNNRLIFYKIAEKEIGRSKRNGSKLSLIMFDVDLFKNVNDTYGHIIGDDVLVNLARVCEKNIRTMDLLARYGGEEFVILMPDADEKSVMQTAERLRKIVADTIMAKCDNIDISITISLGVVNFRRESCDNINELVNQADKALYLSKEQGRNRVTLWEEE